MGGIPNSKQKKGVYKMIRPRGLALIFLTLFVGTIWAGTLPKTGSELPPIRLEAPSGKQELRYLGLGPGKSFSLPMVESQLVLIEIIGVYCPECHTQAPFFNQLFYRIQKDGELAKKVKMIAIAVGATPTEVNYLKKEHQIPFPIIKDQHFVIHKQLGEPRTPFTMLVAKNQKVLFSHLGVIGDLTKFLLQIKQFIQ
jgi:hypothetical protein